MNTRFDLRQKRKARVRAKITGTAVRPRMSVFRSNQAISVQLIDDTQGTTLVAVSQKGKNKLAGKQLGAAVAKAAIAKGIKTAVFDRSGYRFGGTVKEIADSARAGGLTI